MVVPKGKNIKTVQSNEVKAIDIGFYDGTFFMLDQSSYAWACGSNIRGALGDGAGSGTQFSFVAVMPTRQYVRLIANSTGAIDSSSYAWTWGWNNYGQVGINTSAEFIGAPRSVVGNKQWITLVGTFGTMNIGLDSSSYAWGWGRNLSGNLGDNTTTNKYSPVSIIGAKQFIKICTGNLHVCGLDSSSYAWAWGQNTYGNLGDFGTINSSSPISVIGARQFISIDAGYATTIALDSSSYAWAWGQNDHGQLGDDTTINKSSPVSVLSSQWNKIFVSGQVVFGLKNEGVYTWGNIEQFIHNGTTWVLSRYNDIKAPTKINFPIPAENIKKIISTKPQAGNLPTNFAVLDISSNVWVWGTNTFGQLSDKTIGLIAFPTKPYFLPAEYSIYTPPQSFIKIMNGGLAGGSPTPTSSNYTNTYILDASSYAWVWGGNSYGELGVGNYATVYASSPVSVIGGIQFRALNINTDFTAVSISQYRGNCVLGLDISSYAWAWGLNQWGQCGNNTTKSVLFEYSPVSVVGGKQWLKVITSGTSSYGIDASSYLWSWGYNVTGQLGTNTIINVSSPVSVVGARKVLDVAVAGGYDPVRLTAAFIDSSSYVWTFGHGGQSLIGDNTITSRSSPVSVLGSRRCINLYGTWYHLYALDVSSYLWAWGGSGSFSYGLGNNANTPRSSPVSVAGNRQFLPNATYTNNSSRGMVAIDSFSYAWAWGENNFGQLGDGSVVTRSSPVSVRNGFQFNYVEMGRYGLFGVVDNYPASQYICCGANSIGTGRRYLNDCMVDNAILSFPVAVTFAQKYMSYPISYVRNNRKNILGK